MGYTEIEFIISKKGELKDLVILNTSGNKKLDYLSINTINRASKSFPKPKKR
ncbi:energy transducer TonB [Helicobacter sp. MIT 14-3879]|uniref:energy transducer TonB n=1 Tax=Helicobacter sp. MIT 14-3879 TaxID=2040649 RepID=UPI0038D23020